MFLIHPACVMRFTILHPTLPTRSAGGIMIEFKYKLEEEIIEHYAKLLGDKSAQDFLRSKSVTSKEEVQSIAHFYWNMVEFNVKEDERGQCKYEDMEIWLERIYTSLHIYFNNMGYGDIWDAEIP